MKTEINTQVNTQVKFEDLSYEHWLTMANERAQKGDDKGARAIVLKMREVWPDRVFNPNNKPKRNGGD